MTACNWGLQMPRIGQAQWMRDQSDAKAGLDAELFCVLSKAVEELELEWSASKEHAATLMNAGIKVLSCCNGFPLIAAGLLATSAIL